ncbi:MAG: hypothetical protein JNL67_00495 [Planctomycetaceae bacterium]|nr:hypothetical protein [Planctomycetaceae bacterium]
MSQFNNPHSQMPLGQKPMPVGTPYDMAPQRPSSGSNIVLIVLAIVFGLMLIVVLACGALGFMATRAVTNLGKEFEGLVIQPMANEAVQRYQDHAEVQKHIGEIEDYRFEKPSIDLVNRPVVRLEVEGDKGHGQIVFYRRGGRPHKVMLEVNGQEILLDDDPKDLFQSDFDKSDFERMSEFESMDSDSENEAKNEPSELPNSN